SASRPSPSYTRTNSPRRRQARACSRSTVLRPRAAYIKIIVRTILLVRRVSKRSPYFVAADGVQDVGSPHRRGPGSRRDAGHHRLASGATVDWDEGGGSRARPDRGGPTDLHRRHGGLGLGGPGQRAQGSHRASASPPDATPPGERCPIEPGEGTRAPNPGRGPHHVRGPALHRGRSAMANPAERELEGPRVYLHVPRSGPQRTRRLDGRLSRPRPSSNPPAGPR